MDKILYLTLLYDFYGELLSDKQKRIFYMYYLQDFSLQEIAEQLLISRQGVRDNLIRCEKSLYKYEEHLQLIARHIKYNGLAIEITERLNQIRGRYAEDDMLNNTIDIIIDFFKDL